MAQITDITSYILDKFKQEAASVLDDANKKYAIELEEAEKKAQIRYDEIIADAKKEADRSLEMAQSSARQLKAKRILQIKNEAVENILTKAKNKIINLDDKAYEAILISLMKKYHENKKGEIIFASGDEKRNLDLLKKEANKMELEISKDKAQISGGFILKYGSVEQNCSIDAIFKDKKEELTDYINSKLFN